VYLPVPRYVVTFAANSHFFENTFFGGNFDVGVPFNGSAHSLTALHLRNDPYNGTYLAFDQHFVWDQDYIAFGIDPLTQQERQYNLVAYKRWTPKFESRLFLQESAAQAGIINRPTNAAGFGELQLSGGFRAPTSVTPGQLLSISAGDTAGPHRSEHADCELRPALEGSTRSTACSRSPAGRRRSSAGRSGCICDRAQAPASRTTSTARVGYPNEQPGPPDSTYHYLGGTSTPRRSGWTSTASLSASYDRQRMWFNLPHEVDLGDLLFTASDARDRLHLRYYLAYEVKTTDDYWGNQQPAAYTPYPNTVTTPFGTYSGQAAFRGLGTSRATPRR